MESNTNNDVKDNNLENKVIASIYDEDMNYYFVMRNKKIFKRISDSESVEISDYKERMRILNLFKVKNKDIITEDDKLLEI